MKAISFIWRNWATLNYGRQSTYVSPIIQFWSIWAISMTVVRETKLKRQWKCSMIWGIDGKEAGVSFVLTETLTFERPIKLHGSRCCCSIYRDFLWNISNERNREILWMHLAASVTSGSGKSMETSSIIVLPIY